MDTAIKNHIITAEDLKEYWKRALFYNLYRGLIEALVSEKQTTGFDQSEEKIRATRLNVGRMNRVEKNFMLNEHLREKLNQLRAPLKWLMIAEAWCPISALIVPLLNKITEQSNRKIFMKTIFNEDGPGLMEAFPTSGTKDIPKLICMDENFHVLATWGPTEFARKPHEDLKFSPHTIDFKEELDSGYAKDYFQMVEEEIAEMLPLVCNIQRSVN